MFVAILISLGLGRMDCAQPVGKEVKRMRYRDLILLMALAVGIILMVGLVVDSTKSVRAYGTTCDAIDVSRSVLAIKVNEVNAKNPVFMDIEVRAMTSNPVYTIVYCY